MAPGGRARRYHIVPGVAKEGGGRGIGASSARGKGGGWLEERRGLVGFDLESIAVLHLLCITQLM